MKFRKFAVEMTDAEIIKCLSILVENAEIIRFRRHEDDNSINIRFKVLGDRRRDEYDLILLSDSVVQITNQIPFRTDGEYLYHQYMIAKGFSELWQGNIFVINADEEEGKRSQGLIELDRFLKWISENYDAWIALCDSSYASYTMEQKRELFKELENEGFFAIAYLMLHQSSNDSKEMDTIREIIQNKCISEVPAKKLLEVMHREFIQNIK